MRLVSIERLYFEGELPETEYRFVSDGCKAVVSVDSLQGKEIEGRVERVIPVAREATRKFLARIKLIGLHEFIMPGSFARGRMVVGEVKGAIMIPTTCVVRDRERAYVFVVDGGRARRRDVKVGIEVGEKVQVVSGLSAGEMVVVSGQERLYDGAPVRITRKRKL
jgi:RND family efflux transporter MFP subunit